MKSLGKPEFGRIPILRVTLRGGLGNQLFCYALGLDLARCFGRQLVMDASLLPRHQDSMRGVSRFPPELQNFAHEGLVLMENNQPFGKTNARSKSVTALSKLGEIVPAAASQLGIVLKENVETFFRNSSAAPRWIPDLVLRDESALSLRYDIRSQVRQLKNPSVEYLKLTKEIRQIEPLAVHLREGDYQQMRHLYGPSSSSDYISSAIQLVGESSTHEVWVFSDSPVALEQKKFGKLRVRVITPQTLHSPLETLLLMSQARGLVGANSTFSWWASFLGDEGFRVTLPYYKDARHNISNLRAPSPETIVIPAQGD